MRRLTSLAALALLVGVVGPSGRAAAPATAPSKPGTVRGFQLLGSTSLGNRGMNSPIAVAGRCVYVGDRDARGGVAVVDVRDPRRPKQVNTIPPVSGLTQREIRADVGLGLLVVMNYGLGGGLSGNFELYDITDCLHPKLLSRYDTSPRPPHEFFLWKDPKNPGRALIYATFTLYSPDLVVLDITDPANVRPAAAFDLAVDIAQNPAAVPDSGSGYLHSISVSDDGTRAYMGTWDFGMYVADTSSLASPLPGGVSAGVVVPRSLPVQYTGNVHGAVKVPGKPYAVLVDEAYANAGTGCPFGHLRMADISNETMPTLTGGEYQLGENDCAKATALNGTFSSHNQTVFPNVAFLAYYAGGLRAVDISDPKNLKETGAFVPRATFVPDYRDNRLFFRGAEADPFTGAMWSYPVVQNGLIYVVDIDLGLYILKYTGKHAAEVAQAAYVEGNSAPSRYKKSDPVIKRATPLPTGPVVETKDPYSADVDINELRRIKPYGFFCLL